MKKVFDLSEKFKIILAQLEPKSISTKKFSITGKDLKPLFHAGKTKIKKIDKKKLGERDAGWYGAGFYVSFDKDYVQLWYGSHVTEFEATPDAKVLVATIAGDLSPAALFNDVINNEKELLKARGAEDKLKNIKKQLKENQIEWVHAVDRYAEENQFDIIVYNDYEIIIKNPKAIKVIN